MRGKDSNHKFLVGDRCQPLYFQDDMILSGLEHNPYSFGFGFIHK